jgi:hypothetical protein
MDEDQGWGKFNCTIKIKNTVHADPKTKFKVNLVNTINQNVVIHTTIKFDYF